MTFMQQLAAAWQRNDSLLCVGLDPEPGRFPVALRGRPDALFEFCSNIVDATADLVCCFKPQIAHFAANRAEDALERLIAHIHARHPGVPVILDAKRGDIGSTSAAYAEAFLGNGDFACDAVTVNPYQGADSTMPFIARVSAGRGVFVLVRTSNPSSGEFQDVEAGGVAMWQRVAARVHGWGSDYIGESGLSPVGAVLGATFPDEARRARKLMPNAFILVPGYGAQGASLDDLRPSFREDGTGAIVNSSRGVIFAYRRSPYDAAFGEKRWQEAVEAALKDMIGELKGLQPHGRP